MREVKQKNYTFSNDEYVSVFVGVCKSQDLLNEYVEQDYELLNVDCIGSEFGIDFNINFFDEDFFVSVVNPEMSDDIDKLFVDATVFDTDLIKEEYPNHLDRPYNAVIVVGRLKYEGEVKEIQNEEFGYFKFFGIYPDNL